MCVHYLTCLGFMCTIRRLGFSHSVQSDVYIAILVCTSLVLALHPHFPTFATASLLVSAFIFLLALSLSLVCHRHCPCPCSLPPSAPLITIIEDDLRPCVQDDSSVLARSSLSVSLIGSASSDAWPSPSSFKFSDRRLSSSGDSLFCNGVSHHKLSGSVGKISAPLGVSKVGGLSPRLRQSFSRTTHSRNLLM